MSIRDMLSAGEIESKNPILPSVEELLNEYYETVAEDNAFLVKNTKRAYRMEKSSRARNTRKKIKMCKEKQIDVGLTTWYDDSMH